VTNPAAWHPDPTQAHEYRWWDGTRWTEHVADGGQASVDPLAGVADPGAGATGTVETGSDTEGSSAYRGTDEGSTWQQPEASDPAGTAEQPAEQQPQSWQQPEQSWQQPEQTWRQPEQTWQQPAGQGAGGAAGQPPTWQQTPAWSQPGGEQSAATGTNGIAIAAMIIGIIALLISWIPILGVLAGVLALVLGFVGRSKANKSPAVGGGGAAITGIVTGILATLISIAVTIALFAFGSTFMGSFESYERCIAEGGTEEECQDQLERDIMRRFGQ
jgi:hypothetical protein